MGTGKKRMITYSGEWAKHLRPYLKKMFWRSERQAGKKLIEKEINEKFK